MSDLTAIYTQLDLRLIRRGLLAISTVMFILALFQQHFVLRHGAVGQSRSSDAHIVADQLIDPLAAYEAAFDKSALFGTYIEKADMPVLRSSINELARKSGDSHRGGDRHGEISGKKTIKEGIR